MTKTHYHLIKKEILNSTSKDKFVEEILLFQSEDLSDFYLNKKDIKVFRSARQKNDMPSIFTLGRINESIKDAVSKIKESGDGINKEKTNIVISDSLTIIGNNNDAFIIAFLGGKKHLISTKIYLDDEGNFLSLKVIAEINKNFLPNEKFITEPLEIYHSDNVNEAIKDFAEKKKGDFKLNYKKRPSVFCTWYYYAKTITLKDCIKNLEEIKKRNLPIDTFQIDDGYEDYIGDYKTNKKFPLTLKELAEKIKSYNLIPGIWTSPFIFEKHSEFAKKHKDWILKDIHHKACLFNVNKKNYYILDISIGETWKYLEEFYHKLTYSDGYLYHKLDFSRAPINAKMPNYKNKNITIVEAYVKACSHIRKGMGDAFFLMCGGLYDSLIGIVDAQRTSSDVLSMWSANNRGGKTLPFIIKQSLLRFYMASWWYNDPDSFVVRRNLKRYKGQKVSLGLLNDEEIKTSSLNQLLNAGLFSMTENLTKIDEDRLENIYHFLPIYDKEIEIVNLLDIPRFPNEIRIKTNDNRYYLAIINFEDERHLIKEISTKDILGYKTDNHYYISDFYSQKIKKDKIKIDILPHGGTILKLSNKEEDFKKHYLS